MTERTLPGREEPTGEYTASATIADEKQVTRHEHDPHTSRLRRRVIAIGATVTTIVAGGAFAWNSLRGSDEREVPQAPPAATAGLAPGEGAAAPTPSALETSEPSQEAGPVDINTWNVDTFEYDVQDKKGNITTVIGAAGLEEKYGIKVSEYQDGEDVVKAFVDRMNIWLNSLDTEGDNKRYAQYFDPQSESQLATAGGIAYELAAPAWKRAFTTSELSEGSGAVQDPSEWVTTMRDLNVQNIQDAAAQRAEGGKDNHYAGFKIRDDGKAINIHSMYKDEIDFTVGLAFTGPDGSEDADRRVIMRQVKGENDVMYWKIISIDQNP